LDLHPLKINFYRSLFAALFFLPFAGKNEFKSGSGFALAVAVLSYSGALTAFVWANKLTTAANAIVLQYTAPIFVFIFLHFWVREKIRKKDLQTLVWGMAGVAVIFFGSRDQPDFSGVSIALLSGFLFSVYMTSLRCLKNFDAAILVFSSNLICVLLLFFFVWSDLSLSFLQLVLLAVMGVVQLGLPYFLFSKAVESVPVQEASLIVLIEPVLNPLWVALVVGEIPLWPTILGGAMILFGLALRYFKGEG